MRTPATFGFLLPIVVPGFIVMGALVILVTPTVVGAIALNGPTSALVLGVATGTLVFGYLIGAIQSILSGRKSNWTLPPEAHLSKTDQGVELPRYAVERAGYRTQEEGPITVPLGHAMALERALAGSWGTPEGAGWDRVAYIQNLVIAFATSATMGVLFVAGGALTGTLGRGLRDHAGPIIVLGFLAAWLLNTLAVRYRREAVLELLADARALLLDRGENQEVQRVLSDVGLRLQEEELGVAA